MRDGLGLGLSHSGSDSGRLGRPAGHSVTVGGASREGFFFFPNFLPLSEVFSSSTVA